MTRLHKIGLGALAVMGLTLAVWAADADTDKTTTESPKKTTSVQQVSNNNCGCCMSVDRYHEKRYISSDCGSTQKATQHKNVRYRCGHWYRWVPMHNCGSRSRRSMCCG